MTGLILSPQRDSFMLFGHEDQHEIVLGDYVEIEVLSKGLSGWHNINLSFCCSARLSNTRCKAQVPGDVRAGCTYAWIIVKRDSVRVQKLR